MNYVNTKSKVAHYPGCHLINRISKKNLGQYESIFYASKDGFRVCKCCDPMIKKLVKRTSEIMDYCQSKDFRCSVENGEMMIKTPYSQWKAYLGDNGEYVLYHRNTHGNTSGYHFQTKRYTDAMEVLEYIEQHDDYRLDNPLPEDIEVKKKSAPKKGTKRYRTAMRKAEVAKRRRDVRRVLSLIESISAAQ